MTIGRASSYLAILLLALAPLTLGQVTYTDIDYPGSAGTGLGGINSAGDIVGAYNFTFSGTVHGFVLSQGQFTSFDYPGALSTAPNGINDLGQIVGSACISPCGYPLGFAFVYDGQTFTKIFFPTAAGTEGNGINNAGVVVGRIDAYYNLNRAYKFSNGQFTQLVPVYRRQDRPGASGINNFGEIVGWILNPKSGYQSWSYKNGVVNLLNVGPQAVAFGLNDNGMIVGWKSAGSKECGFVWSNGKYICLHYPGSYSTVATGINNHGQVVGSYEMGFGSEAHGFVTSPITDADFDAAEAAR